MKFKPGDIVEFIEFHGMNNTYDIFIERIDIDHTYGPVYYGNYINLNASSIFAFADYLDSQCTLKTKINEIDLNKCSHLWVKYSGFTDEFYFCTKCNEKQR